MESESLLESDNKEEKNYAKKLKFGKTSKNETDDDKDDNVPIINEIFQKDSQIVR